MLRLHPSEARPQRHIFTLVNGHPHLIHQLHTLLLLPYPTDTRATEGKRPTHPPPHHPPKPRTYSACTAVMPTRFSVSARCAFSCANCACRWVYCLLRLIVEAEAEVEGWAREDVEGRWDEADILVGCWIREGQMVENVRLSLAKKKRTVTG